MAGKRSFQQAVRPFSDSRVYVQYGTCRRKRQRYEFSDGRPSLAAREKYKHSEATRPVFDSGVASEYRRTHMYYGGSRRLNGRYRYSEGTKMGLVELSPKYTPSREEFLHQLREVVGVREVKDHHSKTLGNLYFDKICWFFQIQRPQLE